MDKRRGNEITLGIKAKKNLLTLHQHYLNTDYHPRIIHHCLFLQSFCASFGGSLASVHDIWEHSFLQRMVRTGGHTFAWIGGYYFQVCLTFLKSLYFGKPLVITTTATLSSQQSFIPQPCIIIISCIKNTKWNEMEIFYRPLLVNKGAFSDIVFSFIRLLFTPLISECARIPRLPLKFVKCSHTDTQRYLCTGLTCGSWWHNA